MDGTTQFIEKAGACILSKNVIEGHGRVRWLVREESVAPQDNGWRIFSSIDDSAYLADPENMVVVDFNRACMFEPALIGIWNLPVGSDLQIVDNGQTVAIVDTKTGRAIPRECLYSIPDPTSSGGPLDFIAPSPAHQPAQPVPATAADAKDSTSAWVIKKGSMIIVGLVIVLATIAVVMAIKFSSNPPPDTCPTDTLCVTATKLLQDFSDDFDRAQAAYSRHHVAVAGVLEDAMLNETGDYTAILDGGADNGSIIGCRDLPSADIQNWQTIHPNNWHVTLIGTVVSGKSTSRGTIVALVGCRLQFK